MVEQGEPGSRSVIVTEDTLVIPLTPEAKQKAQDCLKRSGRITFSFREVSVTQLPAIAEAEAVIVD